MENSIFNAQKGANQSKITLSPKGIIREQFKGCHQISIMFFFSVENDSFSTQTLKVVVLFDLASHYRSLIILPGNLKVAQRQLIAGL